MKLNFWQWLGVVLLILGAILFFRDRFMTKDKVGGSQGQPTTR